MSTKIPRMVHQGLLAPQSLYVNVSYNAIYKNKTNGPTQQNICAVRAVENLLLNQLFKLKIIYRNVPHNVFYHNSTMAHLSQIYGPPELQIRNIFIYLFGFVLYVPVNSYGHVGVVISPSHTFSWASLTKQLTSTLCTHFLL